MVPEGAVWRVQIRVQRVVVGLVLALSLFAKVGFASSQTAPSFSVGFANLHSGVFVQLETQASSVGLHAVAVDWSRLAEGPALDALLIQHFDRSEHDAALAAIRAQQVRNPNLLVISISGLVEGALPELVADGTLRSDKQIEAYYANASPANLRGLCQYLLTTYLGGQGTAPEPQAPDTGVLFHPRAPQAFRGADAFQVWQAGEASSTRPLAVIAAHRIHRLFQQPAVITALGEALEARGLNFVIAEDTQSNYADVVQALHPAVIVHLCHSFETVEWRTELDVPHMHSVFFRDPSVGTWQADADATLDASTIAFQYTSQEVLGSIEPIVAAGTQAGGNSTDAFVPIPDRIAHLADRAAAWVHLARTPNVDKRIALIYYNRELGKADLMRGSATGMYMNAPRSLLRVVQRLKEEGYAIDEVPADEDTLLRAMQDHGHQVGAWDPEELERVARSGAATLLPAAKYREWFETLLPAAKQQEVIDQWGPPPGRFQVWTRPEDGAPFLVLPKVELGPGLTLWPQPLRGEAHDTSAAHDRLVPPSHNYLATYLWLQHGQQADAMIHFGTHGTEFLLPGRGVGMGSDDWSELILGSLPNLNVWIINNLGESLPAKRRANAVLIDHLVPPSVRAELTDELEALHNLIDKWKALDIGALKVRFQDDITNQVVALGLDVDLHLTPTDGALERMDAEQIEALIAYLHDLELETIPVSLHTFGEAPPADALVPYVVTCLGERFLNQLAPSIPANSTSLHAELDRRETVRLAAEDLVARLAKQTATPADLLAELIPTTEVAPDLMSSLEQAVKLLKGFAQTHNELDSLVHALAGGFVAPGPGNTPDRNAGVLPTGRNMYLFNPEEVPARPSWELGQRLVQAFLAGQLDSLGRYPEKVGFTLSSFSTFQDYGVMEAQILYLLGVRPVWDGRGIVTGVELIPRAELGRPRIDVFLSALSYYRDMLPSRMQLLDAAVRLAASASEDDNGVRAHTDRVRAELLAQGVPLERAEALAFARLFGYPPGQMGAAGYYYLAERSGEWDTKQDLMDVYLEHTSYAYTKGAWGTAAPDAYAHQIQGVEAILRSWSDRTRSPLSNKYDWYLGGSLSRAVEALTGKEPEFYFSDVRDPDRAQVVNAHDALRADFRVRLFNRKWIEGMQSEGYAGADQIATYVMNTYGWAIMRDTAIAPDTWERIVDLYVRDELALGLREWFDDANPYAFQELTSTLLEAARKGYWEPSDAMRAELVAALDDSVERFGHNGGLLEGGNTKLEEWLEAARSAADDKTHATEERNAPGDLAPATTPDVPAETPRPMVTGRVLAAQPAESDPTWWLALGAAGLVLAGFVFRTDNAQ